MDKNSKIVITGAAGLVGQNLMLLLKERGYSQLVAIDKAGDNIEVLRQLNPEATIVAADLAQPGDWQKHFTGATAVIQLHAQITSRYPEVFVRNNVTATRHVLTAMKQAQVPYLVHISSSVVNSVANDDYTNTKAAQEELAVNAGIPCCVLRPTLMFGWFDRKHLGWLSRFMKKVPIFPIPGSGEFLRQPLYSRDFCRVIIAALEQPRPGQTFDIVGQEEITYIDMIRLIKRVKGYHTWIAKLPMPVFAGLLKIAGWLMKNPPFTHDQLKALTAGDYFTGVDFKETFDLEPTPLQQAFEETFAHPTYSDITLGR
jgi:nucleoside-diphosphate-sugar epimerase